MKMKIFSRNPIIPFVILLLFTLEVAATNTSNDADCKDIFNFKQSDRCTFASADDSPCKNDDGFVNYIEAVFCSFGSAVPVGVIIFVLWWLFLFLCLAVTADDFFCPSLTVIAKVMRMSDNIAGVTLLAFGNGAPDIFSAIAAVDTLSGGDAGLAFGALLGAGVFVTAVVAGAVIVAKPFQCMERPLLRDITFYLAALFFTFYVLYQRKITLIQAIVFLLMYVAYVFVVIIGRYIRKRGQNSQTITSATSNEQVANEFQGIENTDHDPDMVTTYSKHLAEELTAAGKPHHHTHHHQLNDDLPDDSLGYDNESLGIHSTYVHTPTNKWLGFLDAINPICKDEWISRRWYGRIYLICKAPIQLLLNITCPVVDYDCENNNWNRQLAFVQIVFGSTFVVFAIQQYDVMIGGVFPLWAVILIVSFIIAVLAYWFSTDDQPPVWHEALAFLGFIVAVIWIYSLANEVVNLLQLFGVVFNLSDSILGLTLLAWGNSIGDLIADTSLARKGYPRIGISACFGGPLFNLLLGVGIPFTLACARNNGEVQLDLDFVEIILTGSLAWSLLSTYFIATFVLKFSMKRWFGIYLIAIYAIFLIIAILAETPVLDVDVSSW